MVALYYVSLVKVKPHFSNGSKLGLATREVHVRLEREKGRMEAAASSWCCQGQLGVLGLLQLTYIVTAMLAHFEDMGSSQPCRASSSCRISSFRLSLLGQAGMHHQVPRQVAQIIKAGGGKGQIEIPPGPHSPAPHICMSTPLTYADLRPTTDPEATAIHRLLHQFLIPSHSCWFFLSSQTLHW